MFKVFTKPKIFSILFLVIVLIDQVFENTIGEGNRQFTKLFIILSLLLYFGIKGKKLPKKIYYLILSGMVCSLMGDFLQLFTPNSKYFLIYVIFSYTASHVLHGFGFLTQWSKPKKISFWILPLLFLAYCILTYVKLSSNLHIHKTSIILHILSVLFISTTALGRKKSIKNSNFIIVFIGVAVALITDDIFGVISFLTEIPYSLSTITITYAIGHFLIINGLLLDNEYND